MTQEITSWKKERYRRKQCLVKKRLRQQFYRDLTNWTDLMLRNIRANNEAIAKITEIQRGEE